MSGDLRFPYADATEQTLRQRLIETLSLEPDAPNTREQYADAIKASMLEQCVCARVSGKVALFPQYFAAVYGVTIEGKAVKQKVKTPLGSK
jgi:hypothetical protein